MDPPGLLFDVTCLWCGRVVKLHVESERTIDYACPGCKAKATIEVSITPPEGR